MRRSEMRADQLTLTVEHFSERLGCTICGSNRAIPPNVELTSTMDPGNYVTVFIRGNSAAGSTGDERKLHSHSLTALALREPLSRTAISGTVPAVALGVCMEEEQLARFGMMALLDGLFDGETPFLEAQVGYTSAAHLCTAFRRRIAGPAG